MADPKPAGPQSEAAKEMNLGVAVTPTAGQGAVTARMAGGISDMLLPVSPSKVDRNLAMQNLAKAINLALQGNFLQTELEPVYKAARVMDGVVKILHADYIGLGDGVFAEIGRTAKSFQLTFRGPDPASPEGKDWLAAHGGGKISGVCNLIGRKLNLIQEYEDKVPAFVEQMLDRLEAAKMITDWNRNEWAISTSIIGLDVSIVPVDAQKTE